MVLEAYYEPRFSDYSHAYRPNRGCHTALQDIHYGWSGTKWFVEGDLKKCFDNISPTILVNILAQDIKCNRFLKLIRRMLKAGYLENWIYNQTHSGVPQGNGCSPILSNIFLNQLDQFVTRELLPHYNQGQQRRPLPQYRRLIRQTYRAKQKGDSAKVKELQKHKQHLPSKDPQDPNFRRLKYCRYSDDFLLGFAGPRHEAEEIKAKIGQFLTTIGLEMSTEKTLITHAVTNRARFLNYDISVATSKSRPNVNYKVKLLVPPVIKTQWIDKYAKQYIPQHRPELLNSTDFEIVQTYGQELRGIVNYYCLAENVGQVFHPAKQFALASAAKTIASKHKTTVSQVYRKYYKISEAGLKAFIVKYLNPNNPDKPYLAQLGEMPIKRKAKAIIKDQIGPWTPYYSNTELTQRLLANQCELCQDTTQVEVHHIKKLADLKKRYQGQPHPPLWVKRMIARQRKTLVVCIKCHRAIHAGTYDGSKVN
jgi:hypothetical protein